MSHNASSSKKITGVSHFLKAFFTSKNRFWNYLRTPYFMPSKALDELIAIDQIQINEEKYDESTPIFLHDIEYDKKIYKQTLNSQHLMESKLFGQWELPYFLGHPIWFALSFIPGTSAHTTRVDIADAIANSQKATITQLDTICDTKNTLEVIAFKQQLRPWSYSGNGAVKLGNEHKLSLYERAARGSNVLYRLTMYGGAILLTTVAALAIITLMAFGVFGSVAAGFIATIVVPSLLHFLTANVTVMAAAVSLSLSTITASLCINEIFNPGSLVKALSRTLALVNMKSTLPSQQVFILTNRTINKQSNQLVNLYKIFIHFPYNFLKAIVITSPLFLPFYASYKEIPGKKPGKRRISNAYQEQYEKWHWKTSPKISNANNNLYSNSKENIEPWLKVYANFIPSGNIQDITLLRTVLNPFQLMQMILTWITLSTFLVTDTVAQMVKTIPGVNKLVSGINGVFKGCLYGLYALTFTALNPLKQLVAFGTHGIDSPIGGLYKTIDWLHTDYKGNAVVIEKESKIVNMVQDIVQKLTKNDRSNSPKNTILLIKTKKDTSTTTSIPFEEYNFSLKQATLDSHSNSYGTFVKVKIRSLFNQLLLTTENTFEKLKKPRQSAL